MTKKVAVILAGCGYLDGAEITESVSTLIALSRAGAEVRCFAPNIDQMHVVDHLTGEEVVGESRNVLTESARIARGAVTDLIGFDAAEFDALILPGGFGVAKNLSDFAVKGGDMAVQADVARVVLAMHEAGKPIGALCISPVVVSKLIVGTTVTVGQDGDVIGAIEGALGGVHEVTDHGEIVVDEARKIVSTPCYMLDASPAQIFDGAQNLVDAVLRMV